MRARLHRMFLLALCLLNLASLSFSMYSSKSNMFMVALEDEVVLL